jgi:ferredoxin
MDMNPKLQDHLVFYLTGNRSGAGLEAIDGVGLRPALFARFHDLTRLRYDYPLVLSEETTDGDFVHTLAGLVDAVLREIAPRGIEGERLRRSVLRLEREIRTLLTEGATGRLSELWSRAAHRLVAKGGEAVERDLARARAALSVDGQVVDCTGDLPAQLLTHAWRAVQDSKARKLRGDIETLAVRLSDLIKADLARSEAGRRAEALTAGIGSGHQGLFDFEIMARLLAKPSGKSALSESRRQRIETALAVLRAQRFYASDSAYSFGFSDIEAALAAFRDRLPAMAELVKAMAIAELEVDGRYVDAKHDAYFAAFDQASLGPQDVALFPDYLVCMSARDSGPAARAQLLAALASGAPLKVLVETNDILAEPPFAEGRFSFGAQLAVSAMGLNEVFVLQAASSHLYGVRDKLRAAMRTPGPVLVSVFSGAAAGTDGLPPYLVSAAAMESRAFPTFVYDPSAGADWATRFSLDGNPQPMQPWPLHECAYADEAMQRISETLPFTFVDFVLCDGRHARHFARVPPAHFNGGMVPLGDWLARGANGATETVPFVYAMDGEHRLHKLIVDEKLVHAARRCAEAWHRLRELEGLKRTHAPPEPAAAQPAEVTAGPAIAQSTSPSEAAPDARSADDPYIETERCTSCNECTQINSVMFAYNANQQAYIADPDAGTYRQLVEAAESCQVSIIHPGKPRNPNEPGLEELVLRAESFA